MKRPPPYAKKVVPRTGETLHILTGSQAWDRANSATWFPESKVVLPPGESPRTFDWSFVSQWPDVIIWCFGEPAQPDDIRSLAAELLQHVELVLYFGPNQPATRFHARREAA